MRRQPAGNVPKRANSFRDPGVCAPHPLPSVECAAVPSAPPRRRARRRLGSLWLGRCRRRAQLHHPEAFRTYEKEWDQYVENRLPVYTDADLFEQNVVITFDNSKPLTEGALAELVKQVSHDNMKLFSK